MSYLSSYIGKHIRFASTICLLLKQVKKELAVWQRLWKKFNTNKKTKRKEDRHVSHFLKKNAKYRNKIETYRVQKGIIRLYIRIS